MIGDFKMAKFKPRSHEVPDQATLHAYFHYDPKTGELYRKDLDLRNQPHNLTGKYLSFQGKLYVTAKIIFRYMSTDPMPKRVMRVDGDVTNNKWSNFTCRRAIPRGKHLITNEERIQYIPSTQKRTGRIKKHELSTIFRYDEASDQLYVKSKDGLREQLVQTKTLKLRGVTYHRTYLIKRIREANFDRYAKQL